MSDERVIRFHDGTVEPATGYKWCPNCNGMGTVYTMQATPDMDETATECGFCEDGLVDD